MYRHDHELTGSPILHFLLPHHVISKHPVQAEPPEEGQPVDALLLVGSQRDGQGELRQNTSVEHEDDQQCEEDWKRT